MKKFIIIFILLLVVVAGVIVGVYLVRQRQNVVEKASTPTGSATIKIVPSSGDYVVGDTIPVSIYFNPGGASISAIAVRLSYPFSGTEPEIVASEPVPASGISSSTDWTCPVRTSTQNATGEVQIDMSCVNSSSTGFTASTDVLLGTFDLTVGSIPFNNPVSVTFDTTLSTMTAKDTGADILLTPTSSGIFTISAASGESPSPSPTESASPSPTASGTATPSASPTSTATSSPTSTAVATSTPIASATPVPIPVSGVGLPTLLGVAVGLLLLGASALLAL